MKTKPPCKVDGVECAQRRFGCRDECEAWRRWQEIHEQECAQARKRKMVSSDANEFMRQQSKRVRLRYQAEYEKNRRMTRDK